MTIQKSRWNYKLLKNNLNNTFSFNLLNSKEKFTRMTDSNEKPSLCSWATGSLPRRSCFSFLCASWLTLMLRHWREHEAWKKWVAVPDKVAMKPHRVLKALPTSASQQENHVVRMASVSPWKQNDDQECLCFLLTTSRQLPWTLTLQGSRIMNMTAFQHGPSWEGAMCHFEEKLIITGWGSLVTKEICMASDASSSCRIQWVDMWATSGLSITRERNISTSYRGNQGVPLTVQSS